MPDYRAYIIGLDGRIQKAVELDDCGDDDAAIERAQQLVDGHDVELWQNERKIACSTASRKTGSSEHDRTSQIQIRR
jgi:hypothetical protein